MKLNFMHILAYLGFGGVYPIYWNEKDKNMPYNIYNSEYACKDFREPNEIQFGQKHKVNQEGTPKCHKKWLSNLYQNPNQHIIEDKSIQHMIDSKTHQHMK